MLFLNEEFEEKDLIHYGMPRRSGRYPWGSGENPYQRTGDFLARVEQLEKNGMNEKDIASEMGMTTTELRTKTQLAKHERRDLQAVTAKSLRDEGKTLQEIADIMGFKNDSSVRALLNQKTRNNKNQAKNTAEILKKEIEKKGMLDVGAGVEHELGISATKLQEALYILEMEGYPIYPVGMPQVTNSRQQTILKVICPKDTTYGDAYANRESIQSVQEYHSTDNGQHFKKLEYPASINSNRVEICYAEDGGISKDGVIELRRGVKDLDLGNSHYAQVRIMVDGSHYLKGMAMYSDDLPDGVDIRFNTNKHKDVPKMEVLKKIKDDPDNPFGAAIKANGQSYYDDPNGKYTDPATGKKQSLSAINKLKEEGDWDNMSRNLSQQFLSKQPLPLIHKQLNLTYADRMAEYDEICSLTNPTIKRKMLEDFANECDSAVIHLKAAALPRQTTQVLLPITKLKENEVYAPNYKNGEKLALIRYPHGGTFEIPILTVNNKNKAAKDILGNVRDAIGINEKVAERLSGADFDGDQAVCIPQSDTVKIKSTPALKGLIGFNPKEEYPYREGMKVMTKDMTQKEMGKISNLITDMTLRGAKESELVRAVKHSMVVIDAEKHHLDFRKSEIDNGIDELKKKYQQRFDENGNPVLDKNGEEKYGGASTLLSRRKQTVRVPERRGSAQIDPETGKVSYKESGRTYIDKKTGETKLATTDVKLLSTVDDLHELSSGSAPENAYADYGNKMKALANMARKEAIATGRLEYSSSAKEAYAEEVSSLNSQLNDAIKNAPRERAAQRKANAIVKGKVQDNPDMDKKERKKISQIAIENSRAEVSASGKGTKIHISDKEWEAIQAGAISDTKLLSILRFADTDELRQRAMPKASTQLSDAKIAKIQSMLASGYTYSEIASDLHVSTSTIHKYIA
jgi:DNA-binding CsgD family transcriptional regulator